ncbi:MAG: hypothetical protein ACRCX2_33340 [Paraclostridium sp.]
MKGLEFELYVNRLEEELLQIPYANRQSGNTVISIRCPFCGDSIKHYNSTHFGVHIPRDEEDIPWYHCFLCGVSGIVKGTDLRDWGVKDHNLVNNTNTFVKKNMRLNRNIKKFGYTKHDLEINMTKFPNDPNTKIKLDYINKRLGLNLSFRDLAKLKIVPNLDEIIPVDVKPSRSEKDLNMLCDHYIGFVSFDNGYITFRRITDNEKMKRYLVYNIFDKLDNTRKFYVIPCEVDMFKPVTIRIAEGPMDILGVYYNVLNEEERTNSIFIAVNGADYRSVILYFMRLGYIDSEYIIYSDNEEGRHAKDINFYSKLKKQIGEFRFFKPLKIVYNVFGKTDTNKVDFGVPKNQIELQHTYL